MRRRNQQRALWLAGGLVAGTALGWFTAPRRGDWLRNQLRQKLRHWQHLSRRTLYKRSRDLENRLRGGMARAGQGWRGRGQFVDANTLVDQVHSQLGRGFAAVWSRVNLNAVGHTVYLRGIVANGAERDRLIAAIRTVPGVGEVDSARLRVAPAAASSRAKTAAPRRRRAS